ncbi:MAG: hypothetical protein GY866_19145 [Proteobacteria bacterium]|nr:hypothetical protein [Pseudomonadota bacterium]
MQTRNDLNVFLNPKSVAVVGATERPGSWGSFIMKGLLSIDYEGKVYPVNRRAKEIYGIPAAKDVGEIDGAVELAIFTIPEESVEEAVVACGEKGVKGITIITAGFGEIFETEQGKDKERKLVDLARSYGIRLVGPNVSGTFNLLGRFNASAEPADNLLPTSLGAVCQGGYAIYELLATGRYRGMGVGKFVHTGNECDLTATDFLEQFGRDPDIRGIVMYLETVRDGKRFLEVAREVAPKKPVVVYKAGRTPGSARAARSHTGALAGDWGVYRGLFDQMGIVVSPTMELLLPLGHALLERPPMRGNRVAILTIGGSWGVSLSDSLEEAGLLVPTLSSELQNKLKELGMPPRASTRNPVDLGAAGMNFALENMVSMAREILRSGEVDALVLHGMGRSGMHDEKEDTPPEMQMFLEFTKEVVLGFNALEKETDKPVLVGSHYSIWESQAIWDLNQEGIRLCSRLDEIAQLLSAMQQYGKRNR